MLNVYTTVGCEKPFFSVTALATNVASRLSSAVVSVVSSFWGKKKEAAKTSENRSDSGSAIGAGLRSGQPMTSLPSSFCVYDSRRRITSATLSPQLDLCALADNFGRVTLLDTGTGAMVRVWKGYREAQVGWIVAVGSVSRTGPATTECTVLVIHAPRRSLLEVWALRTGGRVAAFNVPEGATLVYAPSTVFGPLAAVRDACLLLCDDGRLLHITIPFHLAVG